MLLVKRSIHHHKAGVELGKGIGAFPPSPSSASGLPLLLFLLVYFESQGKGDYARLPILPFFFEFTHNLRGQACGR
jgi:hypothetical protein